MQFEISGKFKPYVRMTQRGKFVKPQAIEYLDSKARLGFEFKAQMHKNGWEMLPGQTPIRVHGYIGPAMHNRDLDNEIKAIFDAMQGVVFPDDRWVDEVSFTRWEKNKSMVWVALMVKNANG